MDTTTTGTNDITGKTIERVEHGTREGDFGDYPITTLIFTDGTEHVFVHPMDAD
jgi:hypothetical protein